jgi:hypothetical protein
VSSHQFVPALGESREQVSDRKRAQQADRVVAGDVERDRLGDVQAMAAARDAVRWAAAIGQQQAAYREVQAGRRLSWRARRAERRAQATGWTGPSTSSGT